MVTTSEHRDSSRCSRSEEHTSELQSLTNLVCRLLLEKKKIHDSIQIADIYPSSNAVRIKDARAYSAVDIKPLHLEHYSSRLHDSFFIRHRFTEDIINR